MCGYATREKVLWVGCVLVHIACSGCSGLFGDGIFFTY